jgi:hypothetical protein
VFSKINFDWGDDLDEKKSVSDYVFLHNNKAIS